MDITWFPFDDQACVLKVIGRSDKISTFIFSEVVSSYLQFGSWTYYGSDLDLVIDKEGTNESELPRKLIFTRSSKKPCFFVPDFADVRNFQLIQWT